MWHHEHRTSAAIGGDSVFLHTVGLDDMLFERTFILAISKSVTSQVQSALKIDDIAFPRLLVGIIKFKDLRLIQK